MPSDIEHQFSVDSQGRLHEASVLATRDNLLKVAPDGDPTSLEVEFMLLRTARLITTVRDSQWSKHGLTYSRVALLRVLYTSNGRLSMGEIAAKMNLGSNGATQLVEGLAQRGLVRRAADDRDKRVVVVELTIEGRELIEKVLPENVARITDAWSPLNEVERQALSHFLAKVRLHLLTNNSIFDQNQYQVNERSSNNHAETAEVEPSDASIMPTRRLRKSEAESLRFAPDVGRVAQLAILIHLTEEMSCTNRVVQQRWSSASCFIERGKLDELSWRLLPGMSSLVEIRVLAPSTLCPHRVTKARCQAYIRQQHPRQDRRRQPDGGFGYARDHGLA